MIELLWRLQIIYVCTLIHKIDWRYSVLNFLLVCSYAFMCLIIFYCCCWNFFWNETIFNVLYFLLCNFFKFVNLAFAKKSKRTLSTCRNSELVAELDDVSVCTTKFDKRQNRFSMHWLANVFDWSDFRMLICITEKFLRMFSLFTKFCWIDLLDAKFSKMCLTD